MRFNTKLLHGNKMGDANTGATLTPVYQSSAFYQPSAEQHEKLFHNKATGFSYTRINNPTIFAFEERMTTLEGGCLRIRYGSHHERSFEHRDMRTGDRRIDESVWRFD